MSTLNTEFIPASLPPELMSKVSEFVSFPSASPFSLPIFAFNPGSNLKKLGIKDPMEQGWSRVWSSEQ